MILGLKIALGLMTAIAWVVSSVGVVAYLAYIAIAETQRAPERHAPGPSPSTTTPPRSTPPSAS
jgi:hypothetical protein